MFFLQTIAYWYHHKTSKYHTIDMHKKSHCWLPWFHLMIHISFPSYYSKNQLFRGLYLFIPGPIGRLGVASNWDMLLNKTYLCSQMVCLNFADLWFWIHLSNICIKNEKNEDKKQWLYLSLNKVQIRILLYSFLFAQTIH